MNKYQRILAKYYAGGDFDYIESDSDARCVGDTLFLFLWRELADSEDCTDDDTAIQRLEMAEADVADILRHVREEA